MDDSLDNGHSLHNTHWIFSVESDYGISYAVLVALAVFYFLVMFILTIDTLWCKDNKVNYPIRIISTIHSISYISSYILCGCMFFLSRPNAFAYYNAFYITHSVAFTFGHLSFYVFMLLRVYYSFVDKNFHESMYMVSVKMMYCHCAILFIDVIIFAFIWYFWYTTWYTVEYVLIFVILSILAGISLLFSIFHFIYTFNSKLLLLTIHLDCDSSSKHVTATNFNNKELAFNYKQLSLINAITKQSLLSCYSLCIIIALMLIGTLLFILHKVIHVPQRTETMSAIFRWFLLIERFTEELSIYLSFVMNDKIYKILCKNCHQSFQNQCHILAKKRIDQQKQIEKKIESDSTLKVLPAISPNFQISVKSKSNSSVELAADENAKQEECDLPAIEKGSRPSIKANKKNIREDSEDDDDIKSKSNSILSIASNVSLVEHKATSSTTGTGTASGSTVIGRNSGTSSTATYTVTSATMFTSTQSQ